jgi:XTP/dITP diphosphohydrolase
MREIVLASNNAGKLREFNHILNGCGFEISAQKDHGVDSIEETGLSFVENAILKARHAAEKTGLPALADDSGIEVDALNGAPGIYSARFAGEACNDKDNNELLLEKLNATPEKDRGARYQCVLVFMRHAMDPTPIIAQGSWEGRILTAPRGEGGFGYDPLFWLENMNCSAAELEKSVKNTMSHRGQALDSLLRKLSQLSF